MNMLELATIQLVQVERRKKVTLEMVLDRMEKIRTHMDDNSDHLSMMINRRRFEDTTHVTSNYEPIFNPSVEGVK